jgi:hypothetical protein
MIATKLLQEMQRHGTLPLPKKLKVKIPFSYHKVVFPTKITIENETHAQLIFGNYYKKTFSRGSYSVVAPKTTIDYSKALQQTEIALYYYVKNPEGELQWPI